MPRKKTTVPEIVPGGFWANFEHGLRHGAKNRDRQLSTYSPLQRWQDMLVDKYPDIPIPRAELWLCLLTLPLVPLDCIYQVVAWTFEHPAHMIFMALYLCLAIPAAILIVLLVMVVSEVGLPTFLLLGGLLFALSTLNLATFVISKVKKVRFGQAAAILVTAALVFFLGKYSAAKK